MRLISGINLLNILLTLFICFNLTEECFPQQQRLFVYKLNDLNFGTVYIGYSKDVPQTDVNAAKFSFYQTWSPSKSLSFSFTLPTNLTNGTNSIPITFDLNHSAWSNIDQISGRTLFDPYTTQTINRSGTNNYYYVWIGAVLNAKNGIPSGTYTGTIIMTVELF
jgi:hypothetical protein